MAPDELTAQDLLLMIGELTVEIRVLRAQLAAALNGTPLARPEPVGQEEYE